MTTKTEARESTRSPVTADMEVRLPSGVLLEGSAKDVSMKGVLFSTWRSLPVGNQVRVHLSIKTGDDVFCINTEGLVARICEDGVAIEFTKIDTESEEHLRRLVLYNAVKTAKTEYKLHSPRK